MSSSPGASTSRQYKGDRPLRRVAELIKAGKARNIVVLTGAGISTSAGIPDFRSPETGLYANLARLNLPFPEAVFELGYFKENPVPFWTLAKDLYPGKYLPTPTHYFLTLLHTHGHLLRAFSQNIDTLETLAGLPEEKIIEAHGSFASAHCLSCRAEASREYVLEAGVREGKVVRCRKEGCGGLVKPDIVFFGEGLPDRFFRHMSDVKKADLLIVIGTSLQVHPFASLPDQCRPDVPRILINREVVGPFRHIGRHAGGGSGLKALLRQMGLSGDDVPAWAEEDDEDGGNDGKDEGGSEDSDDGEDAGYDGRDMFWGGDADEGSRILARELGWEEELDQAIRRGHADLRRRWAEDGLGPADIPDLISSSCAATDTVTDALSASTPGGDIARSDGPRPEAEKIARQVADRLSATSTASEAGKLSAVDTEINRAQADDGENEEEEQGRSIGSDADSDAEDRGPDKSGKIPSDQMRDMGRLLSEQLELGPRAADQPQGETAS